jgi:tetratricopeptide (TPR) repeat protein
MRDAQKEAAIQASRPQPPRLLSLPPDPDRLAIDMTLGYLKIGALDYAIEFSRKITDAPFRARTLARIAAAMAVTGDKEKATGLLAEARKTIKNLDDEPLGLAEISHGYAILGDCEQARAVGLSMPDKWPYIKAPELARIASECAKNGSRKDASQLISESLRVVGLMTDKVLGEEKYEVRALAASAQIDNGEKEGALQLLAQALAGARKAESGIRALEYIAEAYANAGLYQKANEIADSINYRASQADILLDIARRYLSSGDKASALAVLDRSLKISLDNKNEAATSRYKRLAEIAVEYAKAERADRASEVLVEALREIRRQDYQRTELILSVFSAYARSKLTPDETARQLIGKLCSGEAFELTSGEMAKRRRVEESADRFIERWHETLDLNVLFDEMYVSNPKQRQMNGRLFRGVYQFLSASAWSPGVNKDVDDELMRNAFFAFWNVAYMVDEYRLAHQADERGELAEPPELKRSQQSLRQRPKLHEKRITRLQVVGLRDGFKGLAAVYRKYLTADTFKSPTYLENFRREESHESEFEKRFKITPGFPGFGVPDSVEVYYLQKGVFRFYFVQEEGKLKVLTLGFEL